MRLKDFDPAALVVQWCPDEGGMVRAYAAEGRHAPFDPEYCQELTYVKYSDYEALKAAYERMAAILDGAFL
jgi:hypothetical protein